MFTMPLTLNTSAEYNTIIEQLEQREVALVLEQELMPFENFKRTIENIHVWEWHYLSTQSQALADSAGCTSLTVVPQLLHISRKVERTSRPAGKGGSSKGGNEAGGDGRGLEAGVEKDVGAGKEGAGDRDGKRVKWDRRALVYQ